MSPLTATRTALRERPGGNLGAPLAPLSYLETDVPDGMTLRDWRRDIPAVKTHRWWR